MDSPEKVWFREARHVEEVEGQSLEIPDKDAWRKIKERMKTVSVALVLCLNIGVDPPDVQKPNPCARKEAWIEPSGSNPQKTAQKVAQNLQKIYEKLQPRARYKSAIDPTVDCVRKLCTSMRRNAKDERVLFHYNGHGVPKPTEAGEIWVFNKNITQYIPLSLFDLQSWMGYPSVYVWDCNSAGTNVNMFTRFANDHYTRWKEESSVSFREPVQQMRTDAFGKSVNVGPKTMPLYKDCVHVGACRAGELLPQNPDLPADLFTCCLTTPIQSSLLWHMLKTGTKDKYSANILDEIPGVLTDRRTLLGELNWVFTAITDTIAWSSLSTDTFQKLFRQDLLIASLFRSFLLAERIMRENNCHVVSQPALPAVYSHPLWEYWDYTLDLCLNNIHNLTTAKQCSLIQLTRADSFIKSYLRHNLLIDINLLATEGEYAYSHFFIEQLQAFEVWLKFGADKSAPPQQLPVVLQVLLSQVHRVRALELLARFVDLGSWAVVAALSVGIFPYVLKLLQCGTKELRPSLAFIWAKILSVDPVCQHELTKDDGYYYFIQILNDPVVNPRLKIIPAYVMATLIYNNYRQAQEKLIQSDYVTLCMELLSNAQMTKCKMFCLWVLISLGRLWAQFDKARWHAVRNSAYERAAEFLNDDVPEVRAAAVYALGCFVHNRSQNNEHATTIDNEVCDKLCEKCTFDGSVLVRAELAVAIQWFLIDFENRFAELYLELDKKNDQKIEESVPLNNFTDSDPQSVASRISRNASSFFGTWKKERKNVFLVGQPETTPDVFRIRIVTQINALQAKTFKDPFERIWLSVLRLSFDPYPHVADIAKKLVKHIMELAKNVRTIRHKETSKEMSTSGTSDDGQVKFMVGSPGFTPNMRKLSAVENVSQLRNCTSISDLLSAGMVETSSTVFTPKRNMYGGRSGLYKNVNDDMLDAPVQGLVSTQFVEWCSKSFTEPIYKTIYEESSTSTRNSLVDSETPFTSANMTDWALHTQEGLTQKAHSDAQLLKSEQVHCDMQQMYVVMERMITSIAWSFLRPYVYICDGENTTIYHCSNEQTAQKASTIKVYDDSDDAVSDLMIVNELTHELLITGTRNGLIKVWDPMFSEHSHEIQGPAKMVTAAHLLNDQTRTETRKHPNTTLYRWDQMCGKMVCSGNVRVCRIWDAWAEKCVRDVPLRTKGRGTTSIASQLSYNLVSCGFEDGTLAVYDVRLPAAECQIMRLRDFACPIVGSAIFEKDQRLLAGSKEGDIRVWEPRMYQEPIVDFNISGKSGNLARESGYLHYMDVQSEGELIACACYNNTVRIYDVSGGKCLSQIRYTENASADVDSAPSAMRFHHRKVLIGIASRDNAFQSYGVPNVL